MITVASGLFKLLGPTSPLGFPHVHLLPASCILKKMAGKFIERITKSPLLCDGAMGTLLYSKGIFINQCYDELNVSQPELIRGILHEY